MPVTTDSFTEGRLTERLGQPPARLPDGAYDLRGANLARLSLVRARLAGADLREANLAAIDLQRADLAGADLRLADLSDARLQRADLSGARLAEARLRRTVFNATRVAGARLAGALLEQTTFHEVALWETDLTPDGLAAATVSGLGAALARTEPAAFEAAALGWLARLGADPERVILRELLADRRWRGRRAAIRQALRELDRRLGPLSAASLSRAEPGASAERGVSRTDAPEPPA